jgi:hypothetical protein
MNVTLMVSVIHDALVWAQGSREAVMDMIEARLGKTDSKVANRVMGIVKDIRLEEAAAQSKEAAAGSKEQLDHQEHQQSESVKQQQHEAVAAAATADGGIQPEFEGQPGDQRGLHRQQLQQQLNEEAVSAGAGAAELKLMGSKEGEAHAVARDAAAVQTLPSGKEAGGNIGGMQSVGKGVAGDTEKDVKVDGPVVSITAEGKSEQSDEPQGVEGPVVVQERELVEGKGSGQAAESSPSVGDVGANALAAPEAVEGQTEHAGIEQGGGSHDEGRSKAGTEGPVVEAAPNKQVVQIGDVQGPVVETYDRNVGELSASTNHAAGVPAEGG